MSPMTFPIEMNERHMGFAKDLRLGLQRPCRLPALALCAQCVCISNGEPGKNGHLCDCWHSPGGSRRPSGLQHSIIRTTLYWICLRLIWLALAWISEKISFFSVVFWYKLKVIVYFVEMNHSNPSTPVSST